jgi:hypothetical protein
MIMESFTSASLAFLLALPLQLDLDDECLISLYNPLPRSWDLLQVLWHAWVTTPLVSRIEGVHHEFSQPNT